MARAISNPSTDSTTACAKMERTKTARSAPGISMFSTYRPSPRRNRGSSVRRAGMPKVEGGMVNTAIVPQSIEGEDTHDAHRHARPRGHLDGGDTQRRADGGPSDRRASRDQGQAGRDRAERSL